MLRPTPDTYVYYKPEWELLGRFTQILTGGATGPMGAAFPSPLNIAMCGATREGMDGQINRENPRG